MSWLVGSTMASLVCAFLVVRLFDYIVTGTRDGILNTARLGLFVGTWTAVTAGSGMRDFTSRIRQLRQRIQHRKGII